MTLTQRLMDSEVSARTRGTGQGVVKMELSLSVAVRVLDARSNFGRVDVLVTPIAGSGERWIDLSRLHPTVIAADMSGREEQGR